MTQFALKLIALLTMLLDHSAKILPVANLLSPVLGMETARMVQDSMMIIGRMAFPMFAWFIAEGCRKTSSMGKYALRLAVFALLSEVPFQLCFYGGAFASLKLACHNVMFTMLLAVLAVWASQILKQHSMPETVADLLPAAAAIALGWFLHTDYNAWGVALILGLYYMRDKKGQFLWMAAWITVFQLIWHGWNGTTLIWITSSGSILLLYWIGALLSVPMLMTYSGKRGTKCKWLFYVFYPVHLLLLFFLRTVT